MTLVIARQETFAPRTTVELAWDKHEGYVLRVLVGGPESKFTFAKKEDAFRRYKNAVRNIINELEE